MKRIKKIMTTSKLLAVTVLLCSAALLMVSFKASEMAAEDFLKQLGISKVAADKKIADSFLEGYLDAYGVKNVKNIALGNRTAVAKGLLNYAKTYVNTPAFIKQYAALKESKKPEKKHIKTPEELRQGMIDDTKKAIAETEAAQKKADAQLKKIYEQMLVQGKKQLKDAEDPNNKQLANYRKGYETAVKQNEENYKQLLSRWNVDYPENHLHFVKMRLETFLEQTNNMDYSAELTERKGVKYFVKRDYETKSDRWKMAFRAGKEVVEPAREFVQQWIATIQ